jgi:hypothetical protein
MTYTTTPELLRTIAAVPTKAADAPTTGTTPATSDAPQNSNTPEGAAAGLFPTMALVMGAAAGIAAFNF